jgi:hypothetical protein
MVPVLMASTCGEDGTPSYVSPYCLSHPGVTCSVDSQCGDTLFCNGAERCMPGAAGADGCGCIAAPTPTPCAANQTCDEADRRCDSCGTDADGDGHRAPECDGDDCDDHDMNRFPGNTETCDAGGHDEDCNPATFGEVDSDGDQFASGACCNTDGGGVLRCGPDCDDTNAAIVPGAQKCTKEASSNVVICQPNGAFSTPVDCGTSQTCTVQPNGLGVCHL